MKDRRPFSFRFTLQFTFLMTLAWCSIQCVNPQITADGIVFWRDIHTLQDRHLGKLSYGEDRLQIARFDTLLKPAEDFVLSGRDLDGTVWDSQNGGCLRIPAGVSVSLSQFRFIGKAQADTLIIVEGGTLTLEGCELRGPAGGGIFIRNGGRLIIGNSELLNLSRAIDLQNSVLELKHCNITGISGDAVRLAGSGTHSINGLSIANIDGAGISVTGASSVEFKNISVNKVSQSGFEFVQTNHVHLDSVKIEEAGENGINLSRCDTIQFSNMSIEKCQGSGISGRDTRKLRVSQVSTAYNHQNGIEIIQFDSLMIDAVRSRKNGVAGVVIQSGSGFEISQTDASENVTSGLQITDVSGGSIMATRVNLNENMGLSAGIEISKMDSITLSDSFIGLNLHDGLRISDTRIATVSRNDFQKNGRTGIDLNRLDVANFAQNQLTENLTGADISEVDSLVHSQNRYEKNQNGLVSSGSHISSDFNQYYLQQVNGIQLVNSKFTSFGDEALGNAIALTGSKSDVVWYNGNFGENDLGISLEQSTLNMQSSIFSGGKRSVAINQSPFTTIQNCQFARQSEMAVAVSHSQALRITNNAVKDLPNGFDFRTTSDIEFTHNDLERVSGTALGWSQIGSGSIAYNLLIENGTAIKLSNNSGKTIVENNTFIENQTCLAGGPPPLLSVGYNIFQSNASILDAPGLLSQNGEWSNWTYNCFWQNAGIPQGLINPQAGNFIADPVFYDGQYLRTGSPCLAVGPGKRLVGGRGLSPALKPVTD